MVDTIRFERIRTLRLENSMDPGQVADYLQINLSAYLQYEGGQSACPIEVFMKLAHLYNTSVDYILELTDRPEPYPRNSGAKT